MSEKRYAEIEGKPWEQAAPFVLTELSRHSDNIHAERNAVQAITLKLQESIAHATNENAKLIAALGTKIDDRLGDLMGLFTRLDTLIRGDGGNQVGLSARVKQLEETIENYSRRHDFSVGAWIAIVCAILSPIITAIVMALFHR